MNVHDSFLALAAAAIDFPLGADDRRRLDAHLDGCAACRRAARAMRDQADLLRADRVAPLPERRAGEMLDSILAPRTGHATLRLVLLAAVVGLLALGSIAVGAQLLHRASDDELAVVTPTESPGILGAEWVAASFPAAADTPTGRVEAVTAGGPGFVAVGHGCRSAPGVGLVSCEAMVWTSRDGRSWSRVPTSDALDIGTYLPMSGPSIGMYAVAAGPPGVVAIGYAGRLVTGAPSEFDSAVWFSADGTSWERLASPLGSDSYAALRPAAVTWSGDRFVIVGEDRTSLRTAGADLATARAAAAVWTSTDGRAWQRVPDGAVFDVGGFLDTMEDPSAGGMRDVTAGPAGLVAVGTECEAGTLGQPGACTPAAWASADGSTWSRSEVPGGLGGWLGSVAAMPGGYVAAGSEACTAPEGTGSESCPTLVLASADGRTWARQPFAQQGDLRELTLVGDRLLAIAPGGLRLLWSSPDGSSWSPVAGVGDPSTGAAPGGLVAESHLAAGADVAVMVGSSAAGETAEAWYSEVSPAR